MNEKFQNSHHIKNLKHLRKHNKSVKEPCTLPEISSKVNEPWQLEGYFVWRQLDGLTPLVVNDTATEYNNQKLGQYEDKLIDTSTTTLYVDIDGESDDDDLVKILEDEDDRMDKILDDLLDIYRVDN